MTLSPDGKWLWDGTNWIPAPPTEDPVLTTQPNLKRTIINLSSRKKKLIAFSISSLIILTGFIGILYQFGFIGDTIEGEWYAGEDMAYRFDYDGKMYLVDPSRVDDDPWGVVEGHTWRVEDDYLFVNISWSDEEKYRYEIRGGWLFIGTGMPSNESQPCLAVHRNPMGMGEFEEINEKGKWNMPKWCTKLDW